jgi:hypothetical protein
MTDATQLSCTCGTVTLHVERHPIVVVECCCTSCRNAGKILQNLPAAPKITEPNGATHYVLYRKDRVHFQTGHELMAEHKLEEASSTRRVVATCCNTPMFLEFKEGHWLSLYGSLWTAQSKPAIQMRTMTRDALSPSNLSMDVPNPKNHTTSFYLRLMIAWVAMGFKVPELKFVGRKVHVETR